MSSSLAVKVEGLGKSYHIYEKPHDRLLQMLFRGRRQFFREFWALRSASFEVGKGESVGIVGRNGSGKSTLLQLICGTLNPSVGSVRTEGRIAALLELGSGFNPEFTGRENAYLNGSLLGLSRDEMDELMPRIVEFSGIGSFVDQPVKHYSSGMVVRLAFSVQAHVTPEILIVDEALAVGDAVFQHKCARRIHELRERGTTLLFVSHDPTAVATFCDKGVLLHQGEQLATGTAKEIVELYLARNKQELYVSADPAEAAMPHATQFIDFRPETLGEGKGAARLKDVSGRIGTNGARFEAVELWSEDGGTPLDRVRSGEAFRLRMRISAERDIVNPVFCYRIDTLRGIFLTGSTSRYDDVSLGFMKGGQCHEVEVVLDLPLKPDLYSVALYLNDIPDGLPPVTVDGLETAFQLRLLEGSGKSPIYLLDTSRGWNRVG